MTSTIEIRVPDIGDFKDVPVIEVLVGPGDSVEPEQTLLTLESDKATLDVPSPVGGRIESIAIKAGDLISMGALIGTVTIEADTADAPKETVHATPDAVAQTSGPVAAPSPGGMPDFDLVVVGAGPGGYSAAFRASDLGLKVALVERDAVLGGVCLNVGCIPSKALLHMASVKEEAERLAAHGVSFGEAMVDLDKLRAFKNKTVAKLTGGLAQMARLRKVEIVRGTASLAGPESLAVADEAGTRTIRFGHCILAAGSSPVHLPFLPKDERIVDSTGALELPFVPKRLLVIGGGIIGLEMATVYSALGARVDIVERLDGLMLGADREAVGIWRKRNAHRFDRIALNASVESAVAGPDGIEVKVGGAEPFTQVYDLVLQSAGRRPNATSLNLEAAGLVADARGFVPVDRQMRTTVPSIFAIGDLAGDPMLAHKAVHEGHVAAEAAAGRKTAFEASIVPSVAYTDPEIAWVGLGEEAAKAAGRSVKVARFPWAASGRALANGADYGMTKLLFDTETHRVVGGVIVGPSAGDLIGEVCLAIEMGADAVDIGRTIHPHPTLGETVGLAAEVAEGTCTDLPPARS